MEIKDIFFPVTKLPVPPDEVDLIKIVLLESIFKKDENGVVKEHRKVYYETSFEGKRISEGNNVIPSELIPLIFDAKNNQQTIAYALTGFGYALKNEVFEQNPDVFKNPYSIENNLNNLNLIENENAKESTNQPNEQPNEQRIEQPRAPEPSGESEATTPSN